MSSALIEERDRLSDRCAEYRKTINDMSDALDEAQAREALLRQHIDEHHRMDAARAAGEGARTDGDPCDGNPHPDDSLEWMCWDVGWHAQDAVERLAAAQAENERLRAPLRDVFATLGGEVGFNDIEELPNVIAVMATQYASVVSEYRVFRESIGARLAVVDGPLPDASEVPEGAQAVVWLEPAGHWDKRAASLVAVKVDGRSGDRQWRDVRPGGTVIRHVLLPDQP